MLSQLTKRKSIDVRLYSVSTAAIIILGIMGRCVYHTIPVYLPLYSAYCSPSPLYVYHGLVPYHPVT